MTVASRPPPQPMSKIRCPGMKACRTRASSKGARPSAAMVESRSCARLQCLHNQPFDMVRGEELHAHVVPVTRTLPRIIGAEARATAYSRIETRVIGGQRSVEDRRLRTEEHDTVDGRETGKMRRSEEHTSEL